MHPQSYQHELHCRFFGVVVVLVRDDIACNLVADTAVDFIGGTVTEVVATLCRRGDATAIAAIVSVFVVVDTAGDYSVVSDNNNGWG